MKSLLGPGVWDLSWGRRAMRPGLVKNTGPPLADLC